jgi:hypothetical protein
MFPDPRVFLPIGVSAKGPTPRCGTTLKKIFAIVHPLYISAMLFVGGTCAGQDRCNTELKLLLSPAEIQATVITLKAQKKSSGAVYFFDTEKRELLAQGVILRLRRGSTSDLTFKLRLPQSKNFKDPTSGEEKFKCEVDVAADETSISYSVRNSFAGRQIPETGNDIYRAFSKGQLRLLKVARVVVDWNQVKRVADIEVTDWQIKSGPQSEKLALELWEWPRGKILELSRKSESESGSKAYEELRKMALNKGLTLSANQRSKTRMVLEANTTPIKN